MFEFSKLNNLPTDVTTNTCKTQQLFTRCTPIVTWMSSKDTQRRPWCPLEFVGRWRLPTSLGVPGSVFGGRGGGFRCCGPAPRRPSSVWGLGSGSPPRVSVWGGLVVCPPRPPQSGPLPPHRGYRLRGKAQMYCHPCGFSLAPNRTNFCRPPFTVTTTSLFSTRCGWGAHIGGFAPPLPPPLPHPPSSAAPGPPSHLPSSLFSPLIPLSPSPPSLVVYPFRFVATFFLFGAFRRSGCNSSTFSPQLMVLLEL